MAIRFHDLKDALAHDFDDVIDVRSPAEFAEDHIPSALSLPVLSDEERARVGTIYKKDAPFNARKIGAALVARNAARHIETALANRPGGWRPLVYCWRGGQRSASFASILQQIGWRAETVEGGYRSYRRLVGRALYDDVWPGRLVVLDGNTGTGKTAVLAALAAMNVQVLDLEGLARHRGSVLGPLEGGQPAQKAFESGIARVLATLDPDRPLVVEAESSKVGARIIPPSLWHAMGQAPRIRLSAPLAARAAHLVAAYTDLWSDAERFDTRLDQLIPFHGRQVVADWRALHRAGDMAALAADLIERHYDRRYARSRDRAEGPLMAELDAPTLDDAGVARLASEVASALSKV